MATEDETEKSSVPDALRCPKENCKGEPKGTLEHLTGCAYLGFDKDGKPFWGGETQVYWDGQTTAVADGRIQLICSECFEVYSAPEGFELP